MKKWTMFEEILFPYIWFSPSLYGHFKAIIAFDKYWSVPLTNYIKVNYKFPQFTLHKFINKSVFYIIDFRKIHQYCTVFTLWQKRNNKRKKKHTCLTLQLGCATEMMYIMITIAIFVRNIFNNLNSINFDKFYVLKSNKIPTHLLLHNVSFFFCFMFATTFRWFWLFMLFNFVFNYNFQLFSFESFWCVLIWRNYETSVFPTKLYAW